MTASYDVLALGNAIVDVLMHVDDQTLSDTGVPKGAMTLIDEAQAEALAGFMDSPFIVSGGSAANTAAGIALLGGNAAFIGKVRLDAFGEAFRDGMNTTGVAFPTSMALDGPSTARCYVMVTPDGERTMQTYLGACTGVRVTDIDEASVAAAKILYIEGYLWDAPHAKEAIRQAIRISKAHGRKVSLSLSDPFCVGRHRAEFQDLLADIDLLFANESEITALFETTHFDVAAQAIAGRCALAALTRGAQGSVLVTPTERHVIAPLAVAHVVDATGAGDLYAAGLLYGLTHGMPPADAGALAGRCASYIIEQFGARPNTHLTGLLS